MNKSHLSPIEVVVHTILEWTPAMPHRPGLATVLKGALILATRNHQGTFVSFSLPVFLTGETSDGDASATPPKPPRFVLKQIDETVWSLQPSVLHDLLHAFITVVKVPRDEIPMRMMSAPSRQS